MVTYNRDIPDPPNNPSVDVPKMKTNTNSVDDILKVDHISFNATNGGTHLQNTYAGFSAGLVIGTPASSTAYPAAGVADATHAMYYFKNAVNTYPLNFVRAFALVTGSTGAIVGSQSFNVASVVRSSAGDYNITLVPNCTANANYAVFVQIMSTAGSGTQSVLINITNATQFRIRTLGNGIVGDFNQFAFTVVQV